MAAKKLPLNKLLGSISIGGAGEDTIELIMRDCDGTLKGLLAMSVAQIANAGKAIKKTVGLSQATKIHASLHSERISFILANIQMWQCDDVISDVALAIDLRGKNVCFTGTAPIARDALKTLLKQKGANVQSAVSAITHILFIEDENSTSSKAKDARAKGVQILNYSALGI